jgi:hypothetical protein
MINDHEQIIDLDATRTDAAARGNALRDWLIATGWIGEQRPESAWDEPFEPTWGAGPRAFALFPELERAEIAITGNDGFWMTDGDPQPPTCPTCGALYDADSYWELLEGWVETGDEPTDSCVTCGFTAPFGDWVINRTYLGGSNGILIHLGASEVPSDAVAEALLAELRAQRGGRWVHTYRHL